MPRATLIERMDAALAAGPVPYIDLARSLWPEAEGRAWRYATKGGPPGCYMALSAAIRRGGFHTQSLSRSRANCARLVYPRVR